MNPVMQRITAIKFYTDLSMIDTPVYTRIANKCHRIISIDWYSGSSLLKRGTFEVVTEEGIQLQVEQHDDVYIRKAEEVHEV